MKLCACCGHSTNADSCENCGEASWIAIVAPEPAKAPEPIQAPAAESPKRPKK